MAKIQKKLPEFQSWLCFGNDFLTEAILLSLQFYRKERKCRSVIKEVLKNIHWLNSYGHDNIVYEIMAISFVFLLYFAQE